MKIQKLINYLILAILILSQQLPEDNEFKRGNAWHYFGCLAVHWVKVVKLIKLIIGRVLCLVVGASAAGCKVRLGFHSTSA